MSNDLKELLRQLKEGSERFDEEKLPSVNKEEEKYNPDFDFHIMPAGYPEHTARKKGFDFIIFLILICIIFLPFKHK